MRRRGTTRERPWPPPAEWSDGRGEACRANPTSNDGPHLELGSLRRKTWSESDCSIAETRPTYLCISFCVFV